MLDVIKLGHVEYVVNGAGEKTAVLLPSDFFQQLLEDIDDLAAVAERREEETISHRDFVAELRSDGFLHD